MTWPVVTAGVDEHLSSIEEKFRMKGIRHLPIVDHENKVVGLVTQRDLYRILSPRLTETGIYYDKPMLDQFILKHVMTHNPLTLLPDDPLSKAVEIMARNKYGCIPIANGEGVIKGILTETDVLKFLARQLA
jgi:CBS domain-containing protein